MKYFFILLMIISTPSFAIDPQQEIDRFFEILKKEDNENAISTLFKSNKWVGENSDNVIMLKKKIGILKSNAVGKMQKTVMIGSHNIKGVYLHVTYLALYDRQPIRFTFNFYKPENDWFIDSMAFDTNLDEDFSEASRVADMKGNL